MDARRFDLLSRSLGYQPRRALLRASLATFLSAFWLAARPTRVAAICLPPGKRCQQSSQCCSGLCRKKGRKRRKKCAPLPEKAFGCTVEDATCLNNGATPCPGIPNGRCRISINGRPVCAVPSTLDCAGCTSNEDCLDEQGVGAVCIRCDTCQSGTSCICPFFV